MKMIKIKNANKSNYEKSEIEDQIKSTQKSIAHIRGDIYSIKEEVKKLSREIKIILNEIKKY